MNEYNQYLSNKPDYIDKENNTFKKRSPSEETKKKISISLKRAHAEGRAHNIGSSRWNNQPSYPESFFIKIIENEFLDKNYIREFPLGKYSLDFAWPHLKRAIEIDGEQHERFEEYKQRDIRKDAYALENGWTILRIKWKYMFHNVHQCISEAMAFIDKCEHVEIEYNNSVSMIFDCNKISPKDKYDAKYESYRELVLSSNIDFSKVGWVNEVAKIVNITPQHVSRWMKRNLPDIYKTCYKRKTKINNEQIKNDIINSKIDFDEVNWRQEVADILGIDYVYVISWMKQHMPEFYEEKCLKITSKMSINHKNIIINKDRKEKILNSNINFYSDNWKEEVAKIIGCLTSNVTHWMKCHMPEFYDQFINSKN